MQSTVLLNYQAMRILAGDIGGTKTILRIVEAEESNKTFDTVVQCKYPSQDYPDLVPMVREFAETTGEKLPEKACFAIAGPVLNNRAKLTNLSWSLDGERLQQELGIEKVSLINDFAANSYGILGLKDADLHTIQLGEAKPNSPIAVIGAGTGLGQGFLVPQGSGYQVFASEGGHADFAPRNSLEFELLEYIQTKLNLDHVSSERVVSGQGIVIIYQFLRDKKFATESTEIGDKIRQWEHQEGNIDPAAVIAKGAEETKDALCVKTMEIFVSAYGAEAGNLALKLLSYGGVYIAGGVAAKNLPLMDSGIFINAFQQKGRLSSVLASIPVHVIMNSQVGVIGCVLYAMS